MDDLPHVEPVKVYENTYIVGPLEKEQFHSSKVEAAMHEVLEEALKDTNEKDAKGRHAFQWDSQTMEDLSCDIVAKCHDRTKALLGETPRYKLIFHATVGENQLQGVRVASRCLWDKEYDQCATATFSNSRVHATALCFALFFE